MTSEKIKGSSRPHAHGAPVASSKLLSCSLARDLSYILFIITSVLYASSFLCYHFSTGYSIQLRRSFWLARCSITALKVVSWFRSSLGFSFSSSKPSVIHPAWGWRVSISSRVKANLIPIGPYYSRPASIEWNDPRRNRATKPGPGSFVPFPLAPRLPRKKYSSRTELSRRRKAVLIPA